LNLGYGGEDGGGIYHSVYDDFYWYTHSPTPTSSTGARSPRPPAPRSCACGRRAAALRFRRLHRYHSPLHRRGLRARPAGAGPDGRAQPADRRSVFAATADRATRPCLRGGRWFRPSSTSRARQRLGRLQRATRSTTRRWPAPPITVAPPWPAPLAGCGCAPDSGGAALTLNDGLPNRPWFKHQIYAPGLYTGYGVKTLPAVRESIEQKRGHWPTSRSRGSAKSSKMPARRLRRPRRSSPGGEVRCCERIQLCRRNRLPRPLAGVFFTPSERRARGAGNHARSRLSGGLLAPRAPA